MIKDRQFYCEQGPDSILPKNNGPLSGYRFVFKDLFDVAGYQTGAGNPKWLTSHEHAQETSPLIIEFLKQGAECVGRVQTDELAYSLNGQNIHYGTPVNPAAPDCIPGGSSSGSAVAVAHGDADFSIGTDTGGSVRVPASYCGLYGLRPTLGKLDLSHCFELAGSFDTAGIFSRDLDLLKTVYSTLITEPETVNQPQSFYLDNYFLSSFSPARLLRLESWCRNANIQLLHGDFLTEGKWDNSGLSALFRKIQGFEIIQKHGAWLDEFGESLDPSILMRVKWSKTIIEKDYQAALRLKAEFTEQLSAHFHKTNALWVMPTTPSGPPKLSLTGNELAEYRSNLMGLTSIAGLSGFPQLHLPMRGLIEGPCGISLIGLPDQELQLLAAGSISQGECA